ncbi:MAG: hypothetical protein CMJ79_01515 [Planctomycetaceae bacterium]|nr:hypothetical protein [Planctomycetaceae bacterium]|tara:strand:+ start:10015 stop:10215 length:201 start_codon:yes stop_codon:yes gene_type:complete
MSTGSLQKSLVRWEISFNKFDCGFHFFYRSVMPGCDLLIYKLFKVIDLLIIEYWWFGITVISATNH